MYFLRLAQPKFGEVAEVFVLSSVLLGWQQQHIVVFTHIKSVWHIKRLHRPFFRLKQLLFALLQFYILLPEKMQTNLSEESVKFTSHVFCVCVCVCVCLAHFRCRLSGGDHQCIYSVSAAGGFLPGAEDVFGHAAGRRRRKLGEEPARICCESVLLIMVLSKIIIVISIYFLRVLRLKFYCEDLVSIFQLLNIFLVPWYLAVHSVCDCHLKSLIVVLKQI